MSFIRTVLADIPPSELGVCYAHEHIIIDPGFPTWTNPDFLLDSVDVAVEELELCLNLLPDFPDQIMLGMDAARRKYWNGYGGSPGLCFLLTDFSAALRVGGLSEDLLHRVFLSTPASMFSFACNRTAHPPPAEKSGVPHPP